jgi:hypothetical protein
MACEDSTEEPPLQYIISRHSHAHEYRCTDVL